MSKEGRVYEPPKAIIYRFSDQEQILTISGETPNPDPPPEYAANALNQLFGGTNTTIE